MFRWLTSLFARRKPTPPFIHPHEQLLIGLVLTHGEKDGKGWISLEIPKEVLTPDNQNVLVMFSRTKDAITVSVTDVQSGGVAHKG